jgi:hypothetical protein
MTVVPRRLIEGLRDDRVELVSHPVVVGVHQIRERGIDTLWYCRRARHGHG